MSLAAVIPVRVDATLQNLVSDARPLIADLDEFPLLAEWSRPTFADERPVYTRSPSFAFGPRRRQTAVTLNRSQRSSTCRALSFSARSLCSPLRSKMA